MKLTSAITAALLLAVCLPSVSVAKEHEVIITGFGFFPQTTYIQPGDTVKFLNNAEYSHRLIGEEDRWEVNVNPSERKSLTISSNFKSRYNSTSGSLEDGILSLSPPPQEAESD